METESSVGFADCNNTVVAAAFAEAVLVTVAVVVAAVADI